MDLPAIFWSPSVNSTWTEHDHRRFLKALVDVPDDIAGRWQKIADDVPGKTAEEVKEYHDAWEEHLEEIMAGLWDNDGDDKDDDDEDEDDDDDDANDDDDAVDAGEELSVKFKKGEKSGVSSDSGLRTGQIEFGAGTESKTGGKRKKATPWTVEEHRRFLAGLEIYGKGDWRSISRRLVVTRTPTQVASHAQKYFLRQKATKKEKKKASIHYTPTTYDTTVVHAQPKPPPTRGRVVPAPPTSSPSDFYDGRLFEGQGRGSQSPLTPAPVSFYAGNRGGALSSPSQLPASFYSEQGGAQPPLLWKEFQENFIYYPF